MRCCVTDSEHAVVIHVRDVWLCFAVFLDNVNCTVGVMLSESYKRCVNESNGDTAALTTCRYNR